MKKIIKEMTHPPSYKDELTKQSQDVNKDEMTEQSGPPQQGGGGSTQQSSTTDWKEITKRVFDKLVALGKEVKTEAGKFFGKIADIADLATSSVTDTTTAAPVNRTIFDSYPDCVKFIPGIQKTKKRLGKKLEDCLTFKQEEVRIWLFVDGSFRTATKVGEFYCEGDELSLENIKDVVASQEGQEDVNANTSRMQEFNTAGFPNIFYGDYNQFNDSLIKSATQYLIMKLDEKYFGKFFYEYEEYMKALIETLKSSTNRFNKKFVPDVEKLLTDYQSAISRNVSNELLNKAGFKFSLFRDPVESPQQFIKQDISKEIGGTKPVYIYIYRQQKGTKADIETRDANIEQLLGYYNFNCDVEGRKYLERLAYISGLINDEDLISTKDIETQEYKKRNVITTGDYNEEELKGMKQIVTKCSRLGQYPSKYSKLLTAMSYQGIFNPAAKTSEEQTTSVEPQRKDKLGMNKRTMKEQKLSKIIKKTLSETKEFKAKLLQESKITKLRFNILLENKPKTRKEFKTLMVDILSEMIYLHKQGFDSKLISENVSSVFNILGNLFGGSTDKVSEQFKNAGVEYIIGQLNLEGNEIFRQYLTKALDETELKDVPKLFTDCDFITKKVAKSIPEAYLEQIEHVKGMGSEFMSVINDTLQSVVRDSDLSERIEGRIRAIMCPLVEKMSGKFDNKLNTMKSTLVTEPLNNQL